MIIFHSFCLICVVLFRFDRFEESAKVADREHFHRLGTLAFWWALEIYACAVKTLQTMLRDRQALGFVFICIKFGYIFN